MLCEFFLIYTVQKNIQKNVFFKIMYLFFFFDLNQQLYYTLDDFHSSCLKHMLLITNVNDM